MSKRTKKPGIKTTKHAVDTAAPVLLMDQPSVDHADNPAPTAESVAAGVHNPRHGRFTGWGVCKYQNFVFACNATDHQSDEMLAANFTREHPRSSLVVKNGGTFPLIGPGGKPPYYIRTMRSAFNRGRHDNTAPATPLPRFDDRGNVWGSVDK